MRRKMACLVAALMMAWCASPPAGADDPPDGPKRQFRDDFIENLVGDWQLSRQIRGRTVANTVRAGWVLNHQFLQLHFEDVARPAEYEAIVLIGYHHAEEQYVAHWCDVYGGKYSAVGIGRRSGDTIRFDFQYPEGPFSNTFAWDPQTKQWTFTMESRPKDGPPKLFAVDTLRRK